MKIVKPESQIHKDFEEVFNLMEKKGLTIQSYGITIATHENATLDEKPVHLEVVDAESYEPVTTFPPSFCWKLRVRE